MVKTLVSLLLLAIILLAGCSTAGPGVSAPTEPPSVLAAATATQAPPGESPTAEPSPTSTLTPTPSVPFFDPAALGDNRVLDSFIITDHYKNSCAGEVTEGTTTIGYVRQPLSAYHLEARGGVSTDPRYLLGGYLYEKNTNQNFWYVGLRPDPSDVDFYFQADMREGPPLYRVSSAQFVGHEDFEGIPANHFTLDPTNLVEDFDSTGTYKVATAQGDIYLAQDGNYLLHIDIKLTGNVCYSSGSNVYVSGVLESTKELSSINQLEGITLPDDYLALKIDLDLRLPVPTETVPWAVLGTNDSRGIGTTDARAYHLYTYFMPASVSPEGFLEFYRNLGPTNGWTFSGIVPSGTDESCGEVDCVILRRENAQVLVSTTDLCPSTMPAGFACFFAVYYK